MDEQLKSNLLSKKHWMRLLYMVFFAVLFYVAFLVIWVVVAVQFLFALVTGNDNDNVRKFGSSLSQFISQTTRFLTYNSEEKPFPFSDWPDPVVLAPEVNIDENSAVEVDRPAESDALEETSNDVSASSEEKVTPASKKNSDTVVEDSISEFESKSEGQPELDSSKPTTDDSSSAETKGKKPRATRKKATPKKSSPEDT